MRDSFVQMLAQELVPHLDATYRTRPEPASRAIVGTLTGANFSTYAALTAPETFGRLAVQSFLFLGIEDELEQLIDGMEGDHLQVYVVISTNDLEFPGYNAIADSKKLVTLFKKKRIPVEVQMVAGAPSWGSWRAQTDDILEWFAPLGN